ncbi:MAG: cation diffusion facilitator family transporter [Acidobacteriota bacterium]
MEDCCKAEIDELARLKTRQGRVLVVVLVLNGAMFIGEFGMGLVARSTALLGDSLDMLGDAMVYAFSLYVLHRSMVWRAWAAVTKGVVMALFGLGVLVQAVLSLRTGVVPSAPMMAGVAALALLVNAASFGLLWRHRADDVNLRSTWLCSRNDLISNVAVLITAAVVAFTGSGWPDVVVGVGIALLFLRTAQSVLKESFAELDRARQAAVESV